MREGMGAMAKRKAPNFIQITPNRSALVGAKVDGLDESGSYRFSANGLPSTTYRSRETPPLSSHPPN